MTEHTVGEFESLWEGAGARVETTLDGASAVVVIGHDPIATASVALGIGRAQAARRSVVVGDLIGDAAPLRELITDDDPHGITDAFHYGVSLGKIARQVDGAGKLHVLPSGAEPVVQEEILRNDRWRRLAGGFREVGALLVIAAPAAIPGIDALIRMLDGMVLVGGVPNPVPDARVFAEVSVARRVPSRAAPRRTEQAVMQPRARRRWLVPAAAAILVTVAALVSRSYLGRQKVPTPATRRDSAAAAGGLAATQPIDSSPPLLATNPGDSASASEYAVQVAMLDTEEGAALRVRTGGADFPVGTYAPVARGADRGTWYKVVTGAYAERARAEALLSFLRQRGHLPQGWGSVVRAPLALQVGSAPSATDAAPMIADLQSRRVPVYGLRQADGSVRIYTGAFETPEEAALFKSALDSANIDATLVYRVGRAY